MSVITKFVDKKVPYNCSLSEYEVDFYHINPFLFTVISIFIHSELY